MKVKRAENFQAVWDLKLGCEMFPDKFILPNPFVTPVHVKKCVCFHVHMCVCIQFIWTQINNHVFLYLPSYYQEGNEGELFMVSKLFSNALEHILVQ
jgi:hypothetical protein